MNNLIKTAAARAAYQPKSLPPRAVNDPGLLEKRNSMKLSFGMTLLILNLSALIVLHANPKETSVATRVAGGDYPLNLLEIDRHFLVSTNNGYGTQYLQSYDEISRKVIDRLELPSLWFGLAYQPTTKLLIASNGKSGVYTVSFENGS
ncbi:MAG TPA: hypothetical protein VMW38_10860, partial [Terriglobia bacterium]|nr:hypothetical protein [Terriglobia bacterium]